MLKFSRVALSSSTRKHKDNHPVEFVVPGQTSLIPPRWRDERTGGLIPKRTAEDFSYSEFSDRTWKPQLQFVDTRPVPTPRAQWEEERILFDAIERPIIQLAFDKPEAIGMHLKDCVIQGLHVAMTESYLAKVVHWVKEARYWRCIGVYHPFYHPYRLRVHVWRWDYVPGTDYEKGPILGSPLITQPMKDAILDLEKAYRRHQAGLDPAYKWSDWSPCGNPDGSMNDWLPRLPSMRWDPDPDGITATEEDIDFLIRSSYNSEMPNAIHDVMKQRYGFLIYQSKNEDSNPFVLNAAQAGCGRLEVRDFDFPPVSPNLLECSFFVAYCAMMGYTPRETLYDAPTQAAVQKLMSENTEKVEAMRLFRSSSTDLQWIRTYLEEKASLSSFDQTPDRVLTSILIHMYEAMQRIVSKHEPWGKALAQATTLSEYKEAVGPVAYDVAMMLQHANQERIREKWSTRFRSDSSEEKMLDNLLVKMSQRTNPAEPGNIGSTFDREKEPIGRNTQRRIMAHDTGKSSDVKFWEKTRKGTRSSDESSGLDDNVYSTQFK